MAAPDWNQGGATAHTFGRKSRAVTPGASDLDPIAKAVVMLAAGSITIVPAGNVDNTAIQFVDVPAGFIPPYVVRRVTACTSSCATIDG